MMAGIGLGGLIFPWINGMIIEGYGWRAVFRVAALLMAGVSAPIAILLLRDHPEAMGQLPDGVRERAGCDLRDAPLLKLFRSGKAHWN
jgi:MFS family permease